MPFPNYNPSRPVRGEYELAQYIFDEFGHGGNLKLIDSGQITGEVYEPKHLCLERLQGVDKNIDDSNLLGGQEKKLERDT
jgi:hypothetical protein